MFTMFFEFERGEENSVAQLNAALASMRLSSLDIKQSDGYMITKKTFDKNEQVTSVELGYGFDSIELECGQEEGEALHSWQFDVEVLPKGEVNGGNAYHDRWCAMHPDRVMRMMQKRGFDTADAFVVLYHEQTA